MKNVNSNRALYNVTSFRSEVKQNSRQQQVRSVSQKFLLPTNQREPSMLSTHDNEVSCNWKIVVYMISIIHDVVGQSGMGVTCVLKKTLIGLGSHGKETVV